MGTLLRLAAVGLLGWAGCAACGPQTPPPTAAPPSAAGTPPAATAAPSSAPAAAPAAPTDTPPSLQRYQDAQRLILGEGNLEAGIARLEEAVALDPGFAEAWYQLGTARISAAAEARPTDATRALAFWRTGVSDCRHALELADRGSLRLWDAFELADARVDLQEILGLAGSPSEPADDRAALAALDRWAELKGMTPAPEEPAEQEEKP